MQSFEHEVYVVVKVYEPIDGGERFAKPVCTFDQDSESEALAEAARLFGREEARNGEGVWNTRGYVQRVVMQLPIEGDPISTVFVEGKRPPRRPQLRIG